MMTVEHWMMKINISDVMCLMNVDNRKPKSQRNKTINKVRKYL